MVQRFLTENPILDWMEARLGAGVLKRVSTTDGGEWSGPCPVCGGDDRLRVWPTPREGNPRAWCRQCGMSGDALAWATLLAGRDPDARGSVMKTLVEAGFLVSNSATPRATTPRPAADRPHHDAAPLRALPDGGPDRGCWNCGCLEFARDLAGHGWVCVRCHPPGELRVDVARCTVLSPAGTGGAR